jgi:hypothetical protein
VNIDLQAIRSGYDRRTCWVHARGTALGDTGAAVITTQKLRLTGSDVFYELNDLRSDDAGRTWTEPTAHPDTLGRRLLGDGLEEGICDFTPGWHAATQSVLGTGHTVRYLNDDLAPAPRRRATAYSVYDADARSWRSWEKLETPFDSEGAGSGQRVDLDDGDILLATYVNRPGGRMATTVMRCRYDGRTLTYAEHGNLLANDIGRGLYEPSLAQLGDQFFLTLRNDEAGYVSRSDDGLTYAAPQRWTFDDGSDLGNYNTQQHWTTHAGRLHLVYTRRGAGNDHVFRHRAPLFIAQVDPERLCVIRDTEQIVIPERGARLGNFGVTAASDDETWVVAAEWMQTTAPDPHDSRVCERYGSNNTIFLARLTAMKH